MGQVLLGINIIKSPSPLFENILDELRGNCNIVVRKSGCQGKNFS